MRTAATPAEFDALMQQLAPVAEARRPSIARMIFRVVGDCPRCGEPVRRCDSRRREGAQLVHFDCANGRR